MQIRMVATAAGPGGVWPAGSVQDLDEARATALVEGGFAVSLAVERQAQEAQTAQADDERPEQPEDDAQPLEAADEDAPATRTRRRRKK